MKNNNVVTTFGELPENAVFIMNGRLFVKLPTKSYRVSNCANAITGTGEHVRKGKEVLLVKHLVYQEPKD